VHALHRTGDWFSRGLINIVQMLLKGVCSDSSTAHASTNAGTDGTTNQLANTGSNCTSHGSPYGNPYSHAYCKSNGDTSTTSTYFKN